MTERKGQVYMHSILAGTISEDDSGHVIFSYEGDYLTNPANPPVSLTLPLSKEPYVSPHMFPYFDGLIPEGWLLDLTARNWKVEPHDRMGLLLEACHDCIGAVSIRRIEGE